MASGNQNLRTFIIGYIIKKSCTQQLTQILLIAYSCSRTHHLGQLKSV